MKLEHTGSTWSVEDPGGWSFKLETYSDDRTGWDASVRLSARGITTERGAIEHLREPLRRLLAQLDAEFGDI